MKIIIDGYNLLKNMLKKQHITDVERDAFINRLATYAMIKKHSVTIVFDGGPYGSTVQEKIKRGAIVYSGSQLSADDYIMKILSTAPSSSIVLISSDRELKNYAEKRGVAVVPSEKFYTLLQLALHEYGATKHTVHGKAEKLHSDDTNQELDRLMENASTIIIKKDEEHHIKQEKNDKLKKKDRTLAQKIKKL